MNLDVRRAVALVRRAAPALVILSAVGLRVVWPGTSFFIGDEPRLLAIALDMWREGDPLRFGLVGTRGIPYGPVPAWFYAPLVAASLPLEVLLIVKSLASLAAILVGLRWWFGERRMPLAVLVLATHAPFIVLWDRAAWDNPLAIGLTALGVGAYRRWLDVDRWRWLTTAAGFLSLAILTHPMALPIAIAVGIHAMVVHGRPRLRTLGAFALGAWPIVIYAIAAALVRDGDAIPGSQPVLAAAPVALRGFRVFTFVDIEQFTGPRWALAQPLPTLMAASWIVVGFAIAAIVAVILDDRRWSERLRDPTIGLVVITMPLHALLFSLARLTDQPHYVNGTWTVFLATLGIGAAWLSRSRPGRVLVAAGLVPIVVGSWLMLSSLHATAGSRAQRFGVAASELVAVARLLRAYGVELQDVRAERHPSGPSQDAMAFLMTYPGLGDIPVPDGPPPELPVVIRPRYPGDPRFMQLEVRDASGRLLGP